MAKGDKKRAQDTLNTQMDSVQQNLNNLQQQNQFMQQMFLNQYQNAAAQNQQDYGNIQSGYRDFTSTLPNAGKLYNQFLGPNYSNASSGGGGGNIPETPKTVEEAMKVANDIGYGGQQKHQDPEYWRSMFAKDPDYAFKRMLGWQAGGNDVATSGPYAGTSSGDGSDFASGVNKAISGYSQFADTGGYSPEELQAIRARNKAAIRGVYGAAQRRADQAGLIAPGAVNVGATQAKLARESAHAMSDADVNVDAAIAQMVNQGKLAGLSGLASTGLSGRGQDLSAISNIGSQNLGALSGETSAYGTTPAQAALFSGNVLNSAGQANQLGGLGLNAAQTRIGGQQNISSMPSDFQIAMGRIGSGIKFGGQVAGALTGLPTFGYGGSKTGTFNNNPSDFLWGF